MSARAHNCNSSSTQFFTPRTPWPSLGLLEEPSRYLYPVSRFEERIYLSAPSVSEADISAVTTAMRSGWLAPVGPDQAHFEKEMCAYLGVPHGVALSSGTAALHLGLKYLGVEPGDYVIVPTLTFAATAFAVSYLQATPVFVDVDQVSWNLSVPLVEKAIDELRHAGKRVSAVVAVDLYGTPCDYRSLLQMCNHKDVPVLEDAAEGLGAKSELGMVGSLGRAGVISFNGNKIITTSGGGMLVTDDPKMAMRVRHWATQSREAHPWYEHLELGYNYRMSNLLAALGRSQLAGISEEVQRRRNLRSLYSSALSAVDGLSVLQDPLWGESNAWLSVLRLDPEVHPDGPNRIRAVLETANVESRPVWKPMHAQPVYASSRAYLDGTADAAYREGLCLPSGAGVNLNLASQIADYIKTELGY